MAASEVKQSLCMDSYGDERAVGDIHCDNLSKDNKWDSSAGANVGSTV